MKHLGDITKLNGSELPIVDIIVGGSPCQDLSIAGKRQGLAGERSGLFMEQIRIIKEMRNESKRRLEESSGTDDNIRFLRPRFMVWENVPGAFSSNKGEDFRAVLEETAKIVCEDAVIPRPEGGHWSPSGCIMGDGWSIAWRVHDAQFWGVPQRRKRIALVADFGGSSAPEILFERKSMSGNTEQSREERQDSPGAALSGTEEAISFQERSGKPGGGQKWKETEVCDTLNIFDNSETRTPVIIIENHPQDSRWKICEDNVFQTLSSSMGTGGGNVPMIIQTIKNEIGGALSIGNGQIHDAMSPSYEICKTLNCMDDPMKIVEEKNMETVVRRLTPLECERLQGYPDGWTDIGDWIDSKGKKHKGDSDAPRYKALGNSIALPFWEWMAERIVAQYDRPTTMASLFDGIGGFPLVFSRCGCTPVWASEIEEFPIAVTKVRFPEEE